MQQITMVGLTESMAGHHHQMNDTQVVVVVVAVEVAVNHDTINYIDKRKVYLISGLAPITLLASHLTPHTPRSSRVCGGGRVTEAPAWHYEHRGTVTSHMSLTVTVTSLAPTLRWRGSSFMTINYIIIFHLSQNTELHCDAVI